MSQESFDRFRRLVLTDDALQAALKAAADEEHFAALAAELGAARGYDFTAADVSDALRAARRAWLERWLR